MNSVLKNKSPPPWCSPDFYDFWHRVQFMHFLFHFCITLISIELHKYKNMRLNDKVIITDPAYNNFSVSQIMFALLTWAVALMWPKDSMNFPSMERNANLISIANSIFCWFQVFLLWRAAEVCSPDIKREVFLGFIFCFPNLTHNIYSRWLYYTAESKLVLD